MVERSDTTGPQINMRRTPAGDASHFRLCDQQSYPSIVPSSSQRSSQVWSSFQRKTWPLVNRQFRSTPASSSISAVVRGSVNVAIKFDFICSRFTENGMGICPRCTAHFKQTSAGWIPNRAAIFLTTGSSAGVVSSGVLSRSGRFGDPMGQNPMGWIPFSMR